jgi:hypothetical protein
MIVSIAVIVFSVVTLSVPSFLHMIVILIYYSIIALIFNFRRRATHRGKSRRRKERSPGSKSRNSSPEP